MLLHAKRTFWLLFVEREGNIHLVAKAIVKRASCRGCLSGQVQVMSSRNGRLCSPQSLGDRFPQVCPKSSSFMVSGPLSSGH